MSRNAVDVLQRSFAQMYVDLIERLPFLAIAVAVFFLFYFLGKISRSVIRRMAAYQRRGRNLSLALGRLGQSALVAFGVFLAVTVVFPSVRAGTLVQLLGVSSVAIGFAFKDILQNFLAGILILLNEPFRIGDQIDLNGTEGTIEEIQTRASFLRTYDGRLVIIPNSELFTSSVIVNTASPIRRSEIIVGIGYGDDMEAARHEILTALREVKGIETDPAADCIALEFGPSSVNFRVRWWSNSRVPEILYVRDRVVEAVRNRLKNAGIDLPYPTQQVLFHDQSEDRDGDRHRQREGWPPENGSRAQHGKSSSPGE